MLGKSSIKHCIELRRGKQCWKLCPTDALFSDWEIVLTNFSNVYSQSISEVSKQIPEHTNLETELSTSSVPKVTQNIGNEINTSTEAVVPIESKLSFLTGNEKTDETINTEIEELFSSEVKGVEQKSSTVLEEESGIDINEHSADITKVKHKCDPPTGCACAPLLSFFDSSEQKESPVWLGGCNSDDLLNITKHLPPSVKAFIQEKELSGSALLAYLPLLQTWDPAAALVSLPPTLVPEKNAANETCILDNGHRQTRQADLKILNEEDRKILAERIWKKILM